MELSCVHGDRCQPGVKVVLLHSTGKKRRVLYGRVWSILSLFKCIENCTAQWRIYVRSCFTCHMEHVRPDDKQVRIQNVQQKKKRPPTSLSWG